VTLPDGWVYTLGVEAWNPTVDLPGGYLHQDVEVGPFYSDTEVVVELEPDLSACTAPGYELISLPIREDFETGNGGYTISGYNTSWEWGPPTTGPGAAHSGRMFGPPIWMEITITMRTAISLLH